MPKLLLIDDDPYDLDLFKHWLARYSSSFQIKQARSVESAMALMRAEKFDCIVCDFEMPESNGLDLMSQIRELSSGAPFILLTGFGNEDLRERAKKAGADAYFEKGITTESYEDLADCIISLTEKSENKH